MCMRLISGWASASALATYVDGLPPAVFEPAIVPLMAIAQATSRITLGPSALNTYLLHLRYELLRGAFTRDRYRTETVQVRDWLVPLVFLGELFAIDAITAGPAKGRKALAPVRRPSSASLPAAMVLSVQPRFIMSLVHVLMAKPLHENVASVTLLSIGCGESREMRLAAG